MRGSLLLLSLEDMGAGMKDFAERIKRRRIELGLTQMDVAHAVGITQAHVSNIERGTRRLRMDELAKLASILQVSVSWFYDAEKPYESPLESVLDLWFPNAKFSKREIKEVSAFVEDVLRAYVKHTKLGTKS